LLKNAHLGILEQPQKGRFSKTMPTATCQSRHKGYPVQDEVRSRQMSGERNSRRNEGGYGYNKTRSGKGDTRDPEGVM